ncbi:MAG: transglycosylase domain-containing protein [Clostridia bacterium]|nr:transglycosylase domain-containing protein [Clostridia bacterium]
MKRTKGKKLWIFLLSVASVLLLTVGIGATYILTNYELSADLSLLDIKLTDATTRFYYYNEGPDRTYEEASLTEFDETLHGERKYVYRSIDQFPEDLIHAFVAIEDKRFYEHSGVDWYRTLGATANYVLNFDDRFGASTITQQLVKNATGHNEITVERKLQEILWAIDIEKKIDKKEILEKYLNMINLSNGCYGVGIAAKLYFSKEVEDLTLSECVCLAAITNSPSYYDPIRNPENNLTRARVILDAMLEQGYISENEHKDAYASPAVLVIDEELRREEVNSWYVDMVVEDVIDDLVKEYGYSRATASYMVYNGGLRIVTAMNPYIQNFLEQYYQNVSNFGFQNGERAQSGMIIIEPSTGDILGVVGAVGEKSGNRIQSYATTAKRPSGSTIKPLSVYAPALERGLVTYATVYDDVPLKFLNKNGSTRLSAWPQNANLVYNGLVNVNYALKNSLNTVAIKVLGDVGIESSFSFLKDTLGIESLIDSKKLSSGATLTDKLPAALALGQMNYGVTLREMVSAYTIFPNGGNYVKARSYLKVTDSTGKELLCNEITPHRAISSANACIMTKMLQNVIKTGTARPVTLDNLVEVAGKTGTTQDSKDRWFIAYTPYCLCGVWYGYEHPQTIQSDQKNAYLEIWNDVMTKLHRDYLIPKAGRRWFVMDKDVVKVTYCKDSGHLMSPACYLDPRGARSETGYFVKGTEPKSYCSTHQLVDYDVEYGGIACPFCNSESVEKVGLLRVDRTFPTQVYITDAQYVYRKLPKDMMPCADENKPYFFPILRHGEYCGLSGGSVQYNRYCKEHFHYSGWLLRKYLDSEPPSAE